MGNLIIVFIVLIYILILGTALAGALAVYLLQGFAVYSIGKNLGFEKAWLSFVPVANTFFFGQIAEKRIKEDGKPLMPFAKLLLILKIACLACSLAVLFFYFLEMICRELPALMIIFLMIVIITYLILLVVCIALSVITGFALWQIYSMLAPENKVLFLVLSLISTIALSVILFIIRNREPQIAQINPEGYVNPQPAE